MSPKNDSGRPGDAPLTFKAHPGTRRPYTPPELIEYGTVAKLTQTGGQTVIDLIALRRNR